MSTVTSFKDFFDFVGSTTNEAIIKFKNVPASKTNGCLFAKLSFPVIIDKIINFDSSTINNDSQQQQHQHLPPFQLPECYTKIVNDQTNPISVLSLVNCNDKDVEVREIKSIGKYIAKIRVYKKVSSKM